MLDEKEKILVNRTGDPRARRLALEREHVGVWLSAEINDEELPH
jgi:hypothetical protein